MEERGGNRPAMWAAGGGRGRATRTGKAPESAENAKRPLIRIFISSPGDVGEERELARQLVDAELPKARAFRERLHLVSVAWDDPAARIPMLAAQQPQESVNDTRPRPAVCDIVIVILWSRMGTPLPGDVRKPNGEVYLSGTEWEYEDAATSTSEPKPQVLVYRRTEKPKLDIDDPDFDQKRAQYKRIESFFARFRNADGSLRGGVNEYATPAEFRTLLGQHLEELLYRRLPEGSNTAQSLSAPEIPKGYLDWLHRTYAGVDLLGVERPQCQALTLNNVYVPALTQPPAAPPGRKRGRKKMAEETAQRTMIPLLVRLDRESLYVPAPAGAGKSTFCRWAVLQSLPDAARAHPVPPPEEFAEPLPAGLRGRLPVLVALRDVYQDWNCGAGRRGWLRSHLEEALQTWLDAARPGGLTGGHLLSHLAAGTTFLLLDGLDEVPVSETRDGATVYPRDLLLSGLADALTTWIAMGNRILLTSRPYGLDDDGLHRLGLPQAPLEPLPEPLQHLFISRWFHALGKADQTEGLIATLGERNDVAALVENPMMLTALCVLYDSGGRLPEGRYDLFRRIVDNVLFHRFRDDVREREPARARLELIALGMHTGDPQSPRRSPAAEISHAEVDRLLREFSAEDPYGERGRVGPVEQREALLTRSGLLLPRQADQAAFYHLSLQEFLAAERLLHTQDDLEPVFRERSGVAEWRATLLFLFAGKIVSKTPLWGPELLQRLIKDQDRAAAKANPAPAVFIAEALEFCLAKHYAVPDSLKASFRQLALAAIEDEVELQSRHAIGLCLGRLGDPRIPSLRDPAAYVEVPAGSYPSGDDKSGRVEIAAPFRIGRYPVTNGQYAEFIDAGGYIERGRQWWSDAGWAWREQKNVTEPWFRNARRWNAPNQPVVGVSFWEAEACSAWAGGRLPTEEEWEAAARGAKGFEYPWDEDRQDRVCNSYEAGLGVTSPVGLFPRSRQADLGIEDLAGNVWEWCAGLDDPAGKNDSSARVLRGGSWLVNLGSARSAYRLRLHPDGRSHTVGFRVVCSSPIFEH